MRLEYGITTHTQETSNREQQRVVITNDNSPLLNGSDREFGQHVATLGPAATAGAGKRPTGGLPPTYCLVLRIDTDTYLDTAHRRGPEFFRLLQPLCKSWRGPG